MPSKSTSKVPLIRLKGFYSKHQNKQNNLAGTSSKRFSASNPHLKDASSPESEVNKDVSFSIQSPSLILRKYGETGSGNDLPVNHFKLLGGGSLEVSPQTRNDKDIVKLSQPITKNYFKYFCTSAVKHLPHKNQSKEILQSSGKYSVESGLEGFDVTTSRIKKSENKIVSLPNNLTIEAIQYKCKILQIHDSKCGCSSPRLHIYLATNHRCSDKCPTATYQCVDNILPSSSIGINKKRLIFAVMTGKSRGRRNSRRGSNVQRVRKNARQKVHKSVSSYISRGASSRELDAKESSTTRSKNEEPESELLGEECESLPAIMNTLSGDVEYIVLDDNTFNLGTNLEDRDLLGVIDSKASDISEALHKKPETQTFDNAIASKESGNLDNILERCLSDASYQSNKAKGLALPQDKIKCEPNEDVNATKNTENSSLAEICTNHSPSIRDIFGDISIKDEPLDVVDDNDMSIDDFSKEIRKLTDSSKLAESDGKWPISKVTSLKKKVTANKGSFAGLLKEEAKATADDSKGDISPSDMTIKNENGDNEVSPTDMTVKKEKGEGIIPPSNITVKKEHEDNEQNSKEDDDYSSDSSLAPLQIDEGEQAPAEDEVCNIPVPSTPATSLILPSVNIISPFKIKIFFGSPHQVQHGLFNTTNNATTPMIGTTPAVQNATVSNRNNKKSSGIEDEDSEVDSIQTLTGDNSRKTPNLTCAYCQTVSPDVKALAKHFEDHQKDGLIICYFCQKSFGDKTSMKRHMRTHTGERPYQCKVCGKRFSLPGNFKKHRDIHEDIRTEPCEVCGKTFRRKEHLKYHMRTHTGEKPYTCAECGTSFTARYSLQIHMNIHLGKKPYKCTYCNKAFSDKSTMRKHVRVHTGEKPFNCELCGRSFGESGTLAAHMATHRSERPFKCKQCDLSFKTMGGLRQHEKIHTGEKQYACRHCGMKFLQKYNMTMHERIHTGEKPYSCNHCNRSFRSRSCLAKHIVLHGGDEERRYECEHCNSRFYRKAHLRRHIDMHLGIKNYECQFCSKKFCTRMSLESHLDTFHSQGARRFPCNWCGRVFKRKCYVNTHECIRDPEKVEKYKQEMKAKAAAASNMVAGESNEISPEALEEMENSSDSDHSSIDIKSEPEEEMDIPEEFGEIESVIGNACFDVQGEIKQDPS